jgi:hypothetical protein
MTEPVSHPREPANLASATLSPTADLATNCAAEKGGAEESIIKRMQLSDWFTAVGTVVIAVATIWNVFYVGGQLREMHDSSETTNKLVVATQNLATAGESQAKAAGLQAGALDKLRLAGEAQAAAADKLRLAGEAQADATKALADNSGRQIDALLRSANAAREQADAARVQAVAVGRSADAARVASDATYRLAASGKAQADALNAQLGFVKDQLAEAKSQTVAIAAQTTAIQQSSAAQVRAAEAQAHAAILAERSQSPSVALNDLHFNGVGDTPDKDGIVKVTMQMEFRNTGGSAFVQKLSTFAAYVMPSLPEVPATAGYNYWGGNDYTVAVGTILQPKTAPTLAIPKTELDAIRAGTTRLFLVGRLNYDDNLGRSHSLCFAYVMTSLLPNEFGGAFPAGSPAYHCQT